MKVIDLYCGAGGFSLGFKQAGFDIMLGVDIWNKALETYELNIKSEILNKDVRELRKYNLPECDVLIGSPPCPDFSIAKFRGSGWGNKQMDLSCINAFYKILNYLKPKYWIWENVLGINKYLFFQPSAILNAQNYNVPQRRKRIFIGNYPLPKENKFKGSVAPTIIAWELLGGWKGSDNTRRFSQWLGRKPTYQEIAFYMGFPSDYEFLGNQKDKSIQIGNAVCPPIAKAIAEAILKIIDK